MEYFLVNHLEFGSARQPETVATPPKVGRAGILDRQRAQVSRGADSQGPDVAHRLVPMRGKRAIEHASELGAIGLTAGLQNVVDPGQLSVVLLGAIEQQRVERFAKQKGCSRRHLRVVEAERSLDDVRPGCRALVGLE